MLNDVLPYAIVEIVYSLNNSIVLSVQSLDQNKNTRCMQDLS